MRKLTFALSALVLGGAVLALAGCSGTASKSSCGGSTCDSGEVCSGNVCRRVCQTDPQCQDATLICQNDVCVPGARADAPVITSIDAGGAVNPAAGEVGHYVQRRISISGVNLEGSTVTLSDANHSWTPEICSSNDAMLVVALPQDIVEGSYTLQVANQAGACESTLPVLRGEQGDQGIQGPPGVPCSGCVNAASLNSSVYGGNGAATTVARSDHTHAIVTPESVCPGMYRRGVCLVDYSNLSGGSGTDWNTAVTSCLVNKGVDLCTESQYTVLRSAGGWGVHDDNIFYNPGVWSSEFSDNDGGVKNNFALLTSDDPTSTERYAFGCCQNVTPPPYRDRLVVYPPASGSGTAGVAVTWVHAINDTTFPAAANVCASLGSDLCSKSEYVTLRDNTLFPNAMGVWTNEMSDNDADLFDAVVGTDVPDNTGWTALFGYACCASQRPLNNSCPGTLTGGVCTMAVHTAADALFAGAARACANVGADVCTKSETQVLRNYGVIGGTTPTWTNDGADNDSVRVGGLIASQPDNPDPATNQFAYACCL